jgi:hypothetical protein
VAAASCAGLDAQVKDAISNFLLFNPNMRLGMRHDGVRDIWLHPCFKGAASGLVACRLATSRRESVLTSSTLSCCVPRRAERGQGPEQDSESTLRVSNFRSMSSHN